MSSMSVIRPGDLVRVRPEVVAGVPEIGGHAGRVGVVELVVEPADSAFERYLVSGVEHWLFDDELELVDRQQWLAEIVEILDMVTP